MKLTIHHFIFFVTLIFSSPLPAQIVDTLINVGNHRLHFTIQEGRGVPILFEAGSGNDGTIWKDITSTVHNITGATIITYDRAGMGQSELNPILEKNEKGLLTHGVRDLEIALQKLGYREEIIVVAHSYGGLYANMYAARNPSQVKGIVLIDCNLIEVYTEKYLGQYRARNTVGFLDTIKTHSLGVYYECLAFEQTIAEMKKVSFPTTIPIIDIVAGRQYDAFNDSTNITRRLAAHKNFVANNLNRTAITAHECGHYVFFFNPTLVVQNIVKLFSQVNPQLNQQKLLTKSLAYSIEQNNAYRQEEYQYWHSENAINRWGYELLNKNESDKALKVFELNTILYPKAFNTWDSYGEILLKLNQKEAAIKMYQKSLVLNPNNENGKKILAEILKK